MKLRLSRSQKTTGVMSSTVVFCLDARVELTPQEAADVKKYKLGKQVIYNSEAAKRRIEKGAAALESGSIGGLLKGAAGLALLKLTLNITIDSLVQGQHIEAKDMEELVSAEAALRSACQSMKTFLDVATMFDGREEVVDY